MNRLVVLAPLAIVLGTAGLLYGGPTLEPSRSGAVVCAVVLVAGLTLLATARARGRAPSPEAWLAAAALTTFVVPVTPIGARAHFHLGSKDVPWTAPVILAFAVLAARWLLARPKRRAPALLVVAQLALFVAFLDFTGGAIPTRDDHPSFLYRFHLLAQALPHLTFYNAEWNAGAVAYETTATGALSPFLLATPLFALLGVERGFAYLVPYLFVIALPWVFYWALRESGRSHPAAVLGALLAFAPTQGVLLYALHFGVYPFVVSSALSVLVVGLFARIYLVGNGGRARLAAFVAAATMCVLWPLGFVMLIPLAVFAALQAPRWTRREWGLAAVAILALAVINVPWIVDLARFGDSARFVARQRSPLLTVGFDTASAAAALVRAVEELHPLALVFGVAAAGCVSWSRRTVSALLASCAIWSLSIAAVGEQLKQGIALERFAVPFAFFAAAFATQAFDSLLDMAASWRRTVIVGLVLAVAMLSIEQTARQFQNRGLYRYQVLSPETKRILATIRERCAPERRVLVPGFSLHWFDGGHVAALPLLTDRSYVANDYYHRRDYNDAVPPQYRSAERLGEFLELYDVGCVLNWDPRWRPVLEATPELRLLHAEGSLAVFADRRVGGKFLQGDGRVHEEAAKIVVETDDADVVIRYRWVPGLKVDPPATLEPFPVTPEVSFLRLHMRAAKRAEVHL